MDDDITLNQGLEEFYKNYGYKLSHNKKEIPNDVKVFFKSHDIVHILFDCDISLYGEGSVKMWTIFGTTLGFWNHIKEYKKSSAYELSKNFINKHFMKDLFKLLIDIPRLIMRAKQMKKPWPFYGYEPYLNKPIEEIRKEFNIRIT